MKKVIKLLFLLVFFIPLIISADTYKNEIKNANDLLKQEFYINTYEKYILQGKKIKYEYSNGIIKYNSSFIKGGFISKDEYELTKVNGLSYLLSSDGFWTLSKDKKNVYAITKEDIDTSKNINNNYGARVTEYIKPKTVVSGSGTQNDPWQFDPMYKVNVIVNNENATIISGNNEYVKGNCILEECTANIKIVGRSGYRYISNDCNGTYDIKTKVLTINNVKKNLDCNVEFDYGLFTISVTDAKPDTFYAIYDENFYTDFEKKTVLKSLSEVESRPGYTFMGYKSGDTLVVDKDKKLNKDALNVIITDLTMEPTWEANKYKITYDCNGGFDGPQSQDIIFDQSYTLTKDLCKRAGYVQTGWNVKKDGRGTYWNEKNRTNWIWNINDNVTLYAIWRKCNAGSYSSVDMNTCETCKEGTYALEAAGKCSSCPDGYTSEKESIEIGKCFIEVDAGKHIPEAKTNKQVECKNGEYSEKHTVYYGNNSTCNHCPAGYKDGTKLSDKTEEKACLRTVSAGYYIATANASGNTVCENGYYKETHQVRYGSTSSCDLCPAGYRDGSKLENKLSKDKCIRNVTAGYHIAISKSINNSLCPNGQYSLTHSIKYGETSSCSACPEGYQDGRKLENKVSKESCLKNVSAGNYVATEKSEKTRVCSNGFYSNAHQLKYGETSRCSICPEGYRDGVTVSNKTSKDKCLRNVNGGYYIAKANDASNSLCPDGYYKDKHSVTYGSTSSCYLCPEGYRDGKSNTSKSSKDSCTRIVEAGYYIAKGNDKTNTLCENGYYKGTHNVTYGEVSTCNVCPDGYRDGVSLESKTSENKCLRNISAGYYVMGSKSTNDTECPTGYYKPEHSVTYGGISRCVVCPSGYRNGTTVENKKSESSCIRNVPQNHYIAISKDDKNTSCPAGTSKEAHIVKYGEVSTCK